MATNETVLDDFAAELAEVAYPIVLRHGGVRNWLDLELELWRAIRKTVVKWVPGWTQAGGILVSFLPTADRDAAPGSRLTSGRSSENGVLS